MPAHPGIILESDTRAAVVELVSQIGGFGPAAQRFGLARQTLERACAGLGIHPESWQAIRQGISEVLGASEAPS